MSGCVRTSLYTVVSKDTKEYSEKIWGHYFNIITISINHKFSYIDDLYEGRI